MDTPEHRTVRQALDYLKPFLEAFLTQHRVPVESPVRGRTAQAPDIQALLKALAFQWDDRRDTLLPRIARTYAHELLDVRNRWAHEQPFSTADVRRAEETAARLAELLGAPPRSSAAASTVRGTRAATTSRRLTQRELMAQIFREVGRDPEKAIREYAAAERRGEILRKSNKYGIGPEEYARRLLADGEKKGWL